MIIRKWKDVNPYRISSVIVKENKHNKYKFKPYYDTTLYLETNLKKALEGKTTKLKNDQIAFNQLKELNGVVLAFVSQNPKITDKLELTMGGISLGSDYDWWFENKHKPEVLLPLVEKQMFNEMIISYGGWNAGNSSTNIWDIAYKLGDKNIERAADYIVSGLTEYQERITKGVGLLIKDMPRKIDLDIEGINFDVEDNIGAMKSLFKGVAKMIKVANNNSIITNNIEKNSVIKITKIDSSDPIATITISNPPIDINKVNNIKPDNNETKPWEFTITLPVLRSGLVDRDINNVLKPALQALKAEQLTNPLNLYNINIMAMNYGTSIVEEIKKEEGNYFKVAIDAIKNTKEQYANLVKEILGYTPTNEILNEKLIITVLIGVNDVASNYFTLEDAKDLYNYYQNNNLSEIRIWSFARDYEGKIDESPSYSNHGLKYLNLWDFCHVFSGEWTDWVKNPVREV